MADERVFFSHTVEAMFGEAFPPAHSPGLQERYRQAGLDLGGKLLPAYEYRVWRACLEAQREAVFPSRSLDEASFEQGARYVEAYFARTALGKPLLLLLRAIGPRRAVERMSRNFRSGNNFSEAKVEVVSPTCVRVALNDVFSPSPDFIRGMLTRALALMSVKATVRTLSHEGDAATFEVSWGA